MVTTGVPNKFSEVVKLKVIISPVPATAVFALFEAIVTDGKVGTTVSIIT